MMDISLLGESFLKSGEEESGRRSWLLLLLLSLPSLDSVDDEVTIMGIGLAVGVEELGVIIEEESTP